MSENTAGFLAVCFVAFAVASCGVASQWRIVEVAKIEAAKGTP